MFENLIKHKGCVLPHRVWAFLTGSLQLDLPEYVHMLDCDSCQRFTQVCLGSENFGGALHTWLKENPP